MRFKESFFTLVSIRFLFIRREVNRGTSLRVYTGVRKMQYMILIYENQGDFDARTGPGLGAYWGGWKAYTEALTKAGVMVGGNGLTPPTAATTLRIVGGQRQVHDGPYADSKEQLGGYFIIEVPDLDGALEWAARCPALPNGAVEIRPVLQMS